MGCTVTELDQIASEFLTALPFIGEQIQATQDVMNDNFREKLVIRRI